MGDWLVMMCGNEREWRKRQRSYKINKWGSIYPRLEWYKSLYITLWFGVLSASVMVPPTPMSQLQIRRTKYHEIRLAMVCFVTSSTVSHQARWYRGLEASYASNLGCQYENTYLRADQHGNMVNLRFNHISILAAPSHPWTFKCILVNLLLL